MSDTLMEAQEFRQWVEASTDLELVQWLARVTTMMFAGFDTPKPFWERTPTQGESCVSRTE